MEKIRVLHVVGQMNYGGTEAFLMNLLRVIDREKYQFDFVEQTNEVCAHDKEIISLGSKIYRCPHIGLISLGKYRNWWSDFYKDHPEYKIIHGHSRGSAPIYLKEAEKAGRIAIAHCHNNSCGKGIKGIARYIWQLPLRHLGDYHFACSYDSGISQYGKNAQFEVIKNGIITEKFRWNPEIREKIRERCGFCNDDFVIGNVARFELQKNHRFLVKVFKAIHDRDERTKLMLIGTGTYEQEIRETVARLGIGDSVLFVGNRNDVYDYYQAMDAFLLPSLFEGLGIVNIEAQASGLTCFASDRVVASECKVTNLMHFIPLEHSPEEWAEEILSTISEQRPRTDYSEEIRNAGFDICDTAERLCGFYRKVLRDHD